MKHLLKTFIKSQLMLSLLLASSQPIKGQGEVPLCGAYSKVGQIVSELLLPITAQSLIKFINGASPEMQQEILEKLQIRMTEEEASAMNQISDENKKLLFEKAGFQTIKILSQGQAETPEAVEEQLYQQCTTEGVDALIGEMR